MPEELKQWYSVEELAFMLKSDSGFLLRLVKSGQLRFCKTNKGIRIAWNDWEWWRERNRERSACWD